VSIIPGIETAARVIRLIEQRRAEAGATLTTA